MVRRDNEMTREVREHMRGGKGSVEVKNIFTQDEMKAGVRLCARLNINPGSSIGLHEHVTEDEVYYILSGKGLVDEGDRKYEVSAGDAVLTGGGASHSIENIGDGPLDLIAVVILYR